MSWVLVTILFLPSGGKVGTVSYFASGDACEAQVRVVRAAPYINESNFRYRCANLHGRRPEFVVKAIAEELNPSAN